ncbi:hypothetical protein J2S43_002638 [Catenuloplanes nepalensis]|uniref:DUF4253 domain-containing protein n=1 Tax=Catenuloplanes nepalensis TaxID=587533 RepID=A0ABT9MRR5_9ACTN|nr:DUF4253 domain-containing protein [Catenuloplanes nepalensis]MDP9794126.1 hypothetical protein [Catenuloplanes nepalensis]
MRLCALGHDWLAVTVARPVPAGDAEQARRVAAEHLAFCPDITAETSFPAYAATLPGTTIWRFWWD